MKETSYFKNTSRGELIDEIALHVGGFLLQSSPFIFLITAPVFIGRSIGHDLLALPTDTNSHFMLLILSLESSFLEIFF